MPSKITRLLKMPGMLMIWTQPYHPRKTFYLARNGHKFYFGDAKQGDQFEHESVGELLKTIALEYGMDTVDGLISSTKLGIEPSPRS